MKTDLLNSVINEIWAHYMTYVQEHNYTDDTFKYNPKSRNLIETVHPSASHTFKKFNLIFKFKKIMGPFFHLNNTRSSQHLLFNLTYEIYKNPSQTASYYFNSLNKNSSPCHCNKQTLIINSNFYGLFINKNNKWVISDLGLKLLKAYELI